MVQSKALIKSFISIGLAVALAISLLSEKNQETKFNISDILTTVWLVYSIYYKDYFVMIICIIILLYNFNRNSQKKRLYFSLN